MVNTEGMDSFNGAYLRKKVKKNTWNEYWVVMREDKLLFMNENERKIAGIIVLSGETKCSVLVKKTPISRWSSPESGSKQMADRTLKGKESCKFKLQTTRGVHLFKTDCQLNCKKWIQTISRAVQNLCDSRSSVKAVPSTLDGKYNKKPAHSQMDNCTRAKKGFVYSVLSNDDEESKEPEKKSRSVIAIQRKLSQRSAVVKGSFQKWVNFHRVINTSSLNKPCSVEYEVLNEEQ